jgi:hypothetical protein
MPARQWVLDTWVFGVVADGLSADATASESERAVTAIAFLHAMKATPHGMLLDAQGLIEAEYRPHMARCTLLQRWWAAMCRTGRVTFVHGKLSAAQRKHLLDDLRFHDDDEKFVAVAARATDSLLVAEESDYTADVQRYLKSELRITVVGLAEALEQARDP